MDETEWVACQKHDRLLNFLSGRVPRSAFTRKLRLFVCACCRSIPSLVEKARSRSLVELAERYADGLESPARFDTARSAVSFAGEMRQAALCLLPNGHLRRAADQMVSGVVERAAQSRVGSAWRQEVAEAFRSEKAAARGRVCRLLRDVFGNPFRPLLLDPAWRTSAVLGLATAAYENRVLPAGTLEPERFAVLADALEDAGCDNTDFLGHLRGPGSHCRGCWALDLVLGRL